MLLVLVRLRSLVPVRVGAMLVMVIAMRRHREYGEHQRQGAEDEKLGKIWSSGALD